MGQAKKKPETYNPTPVEAFNDIKNRIDGCSLPDCLICPRTKIAIEIIKEALKNYEVLSERLIEPAPKKHEEYTCDYCEDTHTMPATGYMCTRCPVPCQTCRQGGTGPFCEHTPCKCECHARKT